MASFLHSPPGPHLRRLPGEKKTDTSWGRGKRHWSFHPWEAGKEPFNLSQAGNPIQRVCVGGAEWAYKVVPSESERGSHGILPTHITQRWQICVLIYHYCSCNQGVNYTMAYSGVNDFFRGAWCAHICLYIYTHFLSLYGPVFKIYLNLPTCVVFKYLNLTSYFNQSQFYRLLPFNFFQPKTKAIFRLQK